MITSILGRKIGMTQIYDAAGKVAPVTVIEAGPCYVLQVKTVENDGYTALQLGFSEKKEKQTKKPAKGVFAKAGVTPKRFIREVPTDGEEHKAGDVITVETMADVHFVDVTGTSKGKGFAGVVKRWHFRGQPGSHGSMGERVPGSIGSSAYPSRVLKGMKMAGHLGASRSFARGLEVVRIDPKRNLLFVKGAVPGYNGSFVIIQKCPGWVTSRKKQTFKTQAAAQAS
jgi:large subunit ribosomal protein L3